MLVLELRNVGMAYGRRVLFQNVCATIKGGATLVVTGQNGAGKSTLLRIIAGLIRPEAGAVKLECDGAVPGEFPFRRIGFSAPAVNLYANLTGAENLRFLGRLRGVPNAAVEETLKRVGLSPARGNQLVATYSSGMQQRLKLAATILAAPELLIWDEPTTTLDVAGVQVVDRLLSEHRGRGGIVVVATNDPDEAARWQDHTIHVG